MVSERYTTAVAQHLAQTLHKATGGYRCRCGACRHRIIATANSTGIAVARLVSALPSERPIEETKRGRRGDRKPLQEQVAHAMTVSRGREQMRGPGAVLTLLVE